MAGCMEQSFLILWLHILPLTGMHGQISRNTAKIASLVCKGRISGIMSPDRNIRERRVMDLVRLDVMLLSQASAARATVTL